MLKFCFLLKCFISSSMNPLLHFLVNINEYCGQGTVLDTEDALIKKKRAPKY